MNKEQLKKMNEAINTVPIKGKQYAMVHERIKAFRSEIPNGSITTEIVRMEGDTVIIKATVLDEDLRVLGTGHAEEVKGRGDINRTSYIENCETSAVGRALGMCGVGIDQSFATADEVATAIKQQNKITKKERELLQRMIEAKGYTVEEIFPAGMDLTAEQYTKAMKNIEKFPAKKKAGADV